MSSTQDVEQLVRAQLDRITDVAVIEAIRPLLIAPRVEDRPWDYGPPGRTCPCWIVLEHTQSNTGIASCAEGFGPADPWGLLFLTGEHLSMGVDSGCFTTLEDAFRGSMACDLPEPPGYEVA